MDHTEEDVEAGMSEKKSTLGNIKAKIHRRLLGLLDLSEAQQLSVDSLQEEIGTKIDNLLGEEHYPLSSPEKEQLHTEVMDEIFGLGPLEPLLRDPLVSDILSSSASGQMSAGVSMRVLRCWTPD